MLARCLFASPVIPAYLPLQQSLAYLPLQQSLASLSLQRLLPLCLYSDPGSTLSNQCATTGGDNHASRRSRSQRDGRESVSADTADAAGPREIPDRWLSVSADAADPRSQIDG